MPSLGTGHSEIYGISRLRSEIDRMAIFVEVELELTAGGTVATNGGGGRARLET